MAPPRIDPARRLLDQTDRSSDCWIWRGAKTRDGYGVMGIGRNKQHRVHRVAYELQNGPIPAGLVICHHCDTPLCVNPDHLFAGTAKDNTQDMIGKGRKGIVRDVSHPGTKITHQQRQDVRNLRASGATLTDIADKYGVAF